MRQDATYSTQDLCDALAVSRSGFYAHCLKSQRPRRSQDRLLAAEVAKSFARSRHTYGTPRLRQELRCQGHHVGRRRIGRLMRQQKLQVRQKRRFVPRTTQANSHAVAAPQRYKESSSLHSLNQVWVTDITYIPTKEGWLYVAAEMDRFSRKILGWAAADHLRTSLPLDALHKALQSRPKPPVELLHHSDRGCQYSSVEFRQQLDEYGIAQSMSRKGNCYDNAAAESFWATLKTECFGGLIPTTRAQAKSMLFDYIETFYNPVRRHSALGYLSPVDFEKLHLQN